MTSGFKTNPTMPTLKIARTLNFLGGSIVYLGWITMLVVITVTSVRSQNPEILTNAKIVELVRLGLGESVILAKIERSACQCDTSTAAIAKLKAARVTDAIILAMINSGEPSAKPTFSETVIPVRAPPKASEPVSPRPVENAQTAIGQITEPGIYLFENGKMTAIEPTVFSGQKTSMLGTMFTYGLKSSKIRAVVPRRSANLQTSNPRPEFYFSFSGEGSNSAAVMAGGAGTFGTTSPAEFVLVTMRVKDNSREAILGKASAFNVSTNAPDEVIREYAFEKIKPGLYKVVPRVNLSPGEYCFYHAAGGGRGGKLFDFSVR